MTNDEELYRYIVERACDGICIIQDKRLKFINRHLSKFVGYSIEESLDTSFIDYLDLSEINKVSNKYILLSTGQEEAQRYDTILIDKAGNLLDVEINAGQILFNGQPAILAFIRDISERKRHEKELAESEANYRGLVENMLEGVYRTLPEGQILSANPSLVKMLGYDSEKELCRTVMAKDLYIDKNERNRLIQNLEKHGELRNVEYKIQRKDGQTITVMENARVVRDEIGYILYYEGVLTDITDRKKAEENIELLSSISEQSIEGMALVEMNGDIRFINQAFADMHGYSVDELKGKNLSIFHTPEQLPSVIKANELIQKSGKFQGEIWHVKKDGTVFPTLMNNSLLRDKHGEPVGMIGTVLDITELNKATAALRDSEERYRTLQNNVPIAIFRTTPEGILISGNPALAKILEIDSIDKIIGTSAIKYYQDSETLKEIFKKLDREGTVKDYEIKLARHDKSELWLSMSMRAKFDSKGNIEFIDGIALDISARKRAERKLLSTLDQLNATLNTLPDILFEVESNGKILDFRAPNQSMLFKPPAEFLGKGVEQILPAHAAKIIMKAIKEAEITGQCRGIEYSLEIGNNISWFELSLAIKGEQKGKTTRFIAMARDITERKKSEEMLKNASEKLRIEQNELRDKNIALRQILKQIEDERQDYRRQLYLDIDKSIKPFIKKIKQMVKSENLMQVESLELSINSIFAKDLDNFKSRFSKLTARESEICDLIEKGFTSKQISDKLNLSVLTVSKHREQIRKKLGLSNKNINLATHLRTHNQNKINKYT
ncbi:MAG: PAS domain S-box protein [Candidatus Zixiibacteriota bacterium]